MESLLALPNPKLRFEDPVKGLLSSVKIIQIKPTSAPTAGQACSSSDSITFKMPSAGVGKMGSMYLQYDILTNSAGSDTTGDNSIVPVGAVLDEHAPDASIFNRMKVHSSDGTMVSDTANYSTYCSVMNRLKNSRDESASRGSIVRGEGVAMFESGDNTGGKLNQFNQTHGADGGDAVSANELADRFQDGAGRNYRLLSQCRNKEVFGAISGVGTTMCHRIQSGLFDAESAHFLPFFAMGSGYSLELNLEDPEVALKLVGANVAGKLGATNLIGSANTGSYSISNISLVMEVQYYSSEVFSNINEMLCDGIKLRVPRVRTQVNKLTSTSNNIQLAEHGRSINALVCGVRDTDKTGKVIHFHNDFVYKTSDDKVIKQYQTQIGSETVPSNPIKYSAQSYLELERAVGQGREGFRLGNKINANTYYKDADFGATTSGDALFGVSFMSSPEMRDVLSGKASSSGSIPLSLQVDLDGDSTKAELFSIVMSDSVVELLHDGSCIVSR